MDRTVVQKLAVALGVIFLVVGVAGFIPGITTQYDRLGNFNAPGALVLGIIGVNWLENVAHLLYGVGGLALSRTENGARLYFLVGGAVYLVLWIYGLLIDLTSPANFVGVNAAANWLHFLLGVVMVGVGLVVGRSTQSSRPAAMGV